MNMKIAIFAICLCFVSPCFSEEDYVEVFSPAGNKRVPVMNRKNIVGFISAGEKVKREKIEEDWYLISFKDDSGTKKGWLHKKFTRKIEDNTSVKKTGRLNLEQSLEKLKECNLLANVEVFRVSSVYLFDPESSEEAPVKKIDAIIEKLQLAKVNLDPKWFKRVNKVIERLQSAKGILDPKSLSKRIDRLLEKLQSKKETLDPKLLPAVKKYIFALSKIKDIPELEKKGNRLETINSEIRKVILSARNSELEAAGKQPIKKFWKVFLPKQSDQGNKPDCVATSLHMLLRYYAIPVVSPSKLAERINIQRHLGTTTEKVEKFLDERKIPYNSYSSSITDLKEKISTGNPVLVFQISSMERPFGHARLAVGFDDQKGVISVIDPNFGNRKLEISYDDFDLFWLLSYGFRAIVLTRRPR